MKSAVTDMKEITDMIGTIDTIQTALEAYVQECPSEAKSIDKAWGKVTLALRCALAEPRLENHQTTQKIKPMKAQKSTKPWRET